MTMSSACTEHHVFIKKHVQPLPLGFYGTGHRHRWSHFNIAICYSLAGHTAFVLIYIKTYTYMTSYMMYMVEYAENEIYLHSTVDWKSTAGLYTFICTVCQSMTQRYKYLIFSMQYMKIFLMQIYCFENL